MMRHYEFERFELSAALPCCIAEQDGYFWFPKLHRCDGTLLCLVATTADVAQGEWPAACYQSTDAGTTWTQTREMHYSHASVPQKPDQLLLLPYEFWPLSDRRQAARALGQHCSVGRETDPQVSFETVRFLELPRPLSRYADAEVCLLSSANVLRLDAEWITTVYGRFENESAFSVWCFVSLDQGLTWHYRSTVAKGEAVQTPEGASESCMATLPDGRLLCIYRIGSGAKYCYAKSYSIDAGKTWTESELMPDMGSVAPQLLMLDNGALILAGGRPGLHLWCSWDGSGKVWEHWDLGAHHNALAAENVLLLASYDEAPEQVAHVQSTHYLSLIGLSENELLVCYDWLSNGWQAAVPGHKNRVFTLRIRINERKA